MSYIVHACENLIDQRNVFTLERESCGVIMVWACFKLKLGNDRTGNFCFTRTEPNLDFSFAEPNRTRAIHEDLGRII